MTEKKHKKIFLVYRISIVYVFFAYLIRPFANFDLYFIELNKHNRNIKKISSLERLGIIWIKKIYNAFSEHAKNQFVAESFAEKIYGKVRRSAVNARIEETFLRDNVQIDNKNKIEVMWKYYISRAMNSFAQQYVAAEHLLKANEGKRIMILSFNPLLFYLKQDFDNRIRIISLPGFFLLDYTAQVLRTAGIVIQRVRSLFMRQKRETSVSSARYKSVPIDSDKVEVIYFPHKGVFYGDLFKKDHFYNKNNASAFNMKKILHISLGEANKDFMMQSYQFYMDNDIPFTDIRTLSYSRKELIMRLYTLIKKIGPSIFSDLKKYGFFYVSYTLFLFLSITKYMLIFSNFSQLKIALVGYDYLFPRNLSLALSLNDVKVCATQERFILGFWPGVYYIFDYYFAAGNVVRREGLSNSAISHCIPIGLVRVDNLFGYEIKKIYDSQYDAVKRSKKLILALDYHMPASEIEDIETNPATRIATTRIFYEHLIKLAVEVPGVYIVIKGKNSASYKSRFIGDLVDRINRTENIKIELDLKKYNPYYLSQKADLTIACYTSLADELLAAGKPVIFYEGSDLMRTIFDYHHLPIIVSNYKELKYHVENFLHGVYLNESVIKTLQEKYYSNCFHGKVQETVRGMLEKIIKGEDLGEHEGEIVLNNLWIRKANEA